MNELHEDLQLAAEQAAIGMSVVDAEGRFLYVNPAMCDFLGRSKRELLDMRWQDVTHPQDLAADIERMAQLAGGRGRSYGTTKRYLRPDGTVVFGDLYVAANRVEQGEITSYTSQIIDATARVTAERSLDEERRRFQLLAENATDLVFQIDTAGNVEWIAPSVTATLGWTEADLIGRPMERLMHPDDRPQTDAKRVAVRTGTSPEMGGSFVVRILDRLGGYRWVYSAVHTALREDGSVAGAVVGLKVVDDLIAAQRQTKAERDRLRAVVDGLINPLMLLQSDESASGDSLPFVVVGANPAALRSLETNLDELIGSVPTVLAEGADYSRLRPVLARVYQTGEPFDARAFPAGGVDAEGRELRIDVSVVKLAESLSLSWRDVTLQSWEARALEDSRRQFRMLAENATDVVFQTDLGGHIDWASPSMSTVLGYADADLIGLPDLDLVYAEDRVNLKQAQQRALVAPDNVQPTASMPVRYRTKSGESRWMAVRVGPMRDEAGQATGLVLGLRDVTEEREARDSLAYQAFHDQLTGLRNRAWIMDSLESELASARRHGHRVCVMFIDLDHFKVINDSLGHAAGDEVLRAVARRLAGALRPGDHIGRFGGDEYVIVLPDVKEASDVEPIATRISTAISAELHIENHWVVPTVSIGIALSGPRSTAATLLRDTDAALYQAKADGRARWHFFDEAMHRQALTRLTIEAELRRAVGQSEFVVFYQPVVDLRSGRIEGYEALVRWAHPERGLLSPIEFIGVAEASGLILEIGQQVLDRVCQAINQHPDLPGRVGINVSAVQLNRAEWPAAVLQTLENWEVDPGRIAIEVTETAMLSLPPGTVEALRGLRERGVEIFVDDFGTGFSSIALLRDLPVSGLKLDASFVANLTEGESSANALAAGLIGLAEGLNLSNIAEGVETPRQAEIPLRQGWTKGQGYLFGRAEPLERVLTRLG